MKMRLSFLVVFLLLVTIVQAQTSTEQIVLVSDNEADLLVAAAISVHANYTLITTPWGTYDKEILDQIIELGASRVVIIGGPKAIPIEYSENLNALSIDVQTLGGKTRQQTSLVAHTYFTKLDLPVLISHGASPVVTDAAFPVYLYGRSIELRAFVSLLNNDTQLMNYAQARYLGEFNPVSTFASSFIWNKMDSLHTTLLSAARVEGFIVPADVLTILVNFGTPVRNELGNYTLRSELNFP